MARQIAVTRSFQITGVNELDDAIGAMSRKLQRHLMRTALKVANRAIHFPEVKGRAPVGTGYQFSKKGRNRAKNRGRYKGGYIQKSIKRRAMRRSRLHFGYEVFSKKIKMKNIPYHTGYVEYGTKYQEGQHFQRDATYEKSDDIRDLVAASLRNLISREMSRTKND